MSIFIPVYRVTPKLSKFTDITVNSTFFYILISVVPDTESTICLPDVIYSDLVVIVHQLAFLNRL
jgi:hypothetical protein